MSEHDKDSRDHDSSPDDQSRRDFVAWTAAIGIAASGAAARAAAEAKVVEKDVTITTPDGTCDAAYFHPASGTHPGVLIWTDIFGLRPSMREFGRRLAASGYSVLVPNPFYRTMKSPVFGPVPPDFNFGAPENRAKLQQITGPINAAGAIEKDAKAHIAFLDAQSQVNKARPIGTQGYCMGGPLVFRTAATVPERVGAAATFHGGGLVTDNASSPHLLIPRMKARFYVAIATSDDSRQPDAKDKLRAAFDGAHVPAEVVVYTGMQHGWCVPDMPNQANGQPIYDKAEAEKAWGKLLELYQAALA
jgi:carboxymethylenebutenolidase